MGEENNNNNRTKTKRMEQLLLDSKFEAFNYVSFGIFTIVNHVWTWVAVFTAALTFWRIRAAGPKPPSSSVIDNAVDEPSRVLEAEAKPKLSSALVSAPVAVMRTSGSPSVRNDDRVSITKGVKFKLTVYYDGVRERDDIVVDGGMKVTGRGYGGEWWESWEKVLRVRKGERGWYRYQDLTAINGNIVRLWQEI